MNNFVIDDSFIKKWDPRYDETEDDEEDYKRILLSVAKDIKKLDTLSKDVFVNLLIWKTPRLKGIVKLNGFNSYAEAIKRCLGVPEDQRLKVLDDLYGIGVPFASTILHFIYPDEFPIMDIRTVEVLYAGGYIKSKVRDAQRYPNFKTTIFSIQKKYPVWTLRQIDRALFAFHKIALSRK